jgi:hypothetical protein
LKKNNLVKIPIEKISLSDNEPTVIEIPQQNGNTRKIILGSHIDTLWREKDRSVLSIKSAIELAKNPKVKEIFKGEIEEIFMNVRVYDEDRLPHKLSLKFSQNEKDREIWNVVIHDPNGQNPIYDKKMEKYIGLVKELAGESNIKVKIIKPEYRKKDGNNIIKDKLRDKGSFIIPNYADSVRTMGHCGVIANLALPSMMIGELHSQELRAKCSEIGENCVKTLEEELNPKISKTLENRLDFAKKTFLSAENLQEDESKSPPPHVKNPKQKKLKPDSNQKQKNEL